MIRLEHSSTSIVAACSVCGVLDGYRALDETELVELLASHALCDVPESNVETTAVVVPIGPRPGYPPKRRGRLHYWRDMPSDDPALIAEHQEMSKLLTQALARMNARGYPPCRPRPDVSPTYPGEVTRERIAA